MGHVYIYNTYIYNTYTYIPATSKWPFDIWAPQLGNLTNYTSKGHFGIAGEHQRGHMYITKGHLGILSN